MLYRLGAWCAHHPYLVFAMWLAVLVLGGVLAVTGGGLYRQYSDLPGTETQRTVDVLRKDFPQLSGPVANLVFEARPGVSVADPAVADQVSRALYAVGELPRVASVENPFAGIGGERNERAAVAHVFFEGDLADIRPSDLDELRTATAPVDEVGVTVRLGGMVPGLLDQPENSYVEVLGVLVAIVILLLAFGSYLAAVLPVVITLPALGVAMAAVQVAAAHVEVNPTAPIMVAMLGLGAGIDYALFVVTRYREQLADGAPIDHAIAHAVATAGRSILYAGGTVALAISGVWLSGVRFIGVIGVAIAGAVLIMVVAALTLLPAALSVLGARIDRYRLPWVRPGVSTAGWQRWGRQVNRRAVPYALGSIAVLLLLAAPVLDLRFSVISDSTEPARSETRQAYEVMAREFGPGSATVFLVAATTSGPEADIARVSAELKPALQRTPGVAAVDGPLRNGGTAVFRVVPTGGPTDAATAELVHRLRADAIAGVRDRNPASEIHLGGDVTAMMDMADVIRGRMPLVVAVVVGVALVLLVAMFGSVVVPLKAAVMNLLSIGASYGVVVAVFQWGWGLSLVGLDRPTPIIFFVPLFMFAVVFGLSMDYEVFLLSRIKEDYDRSGDPDESVVAGVASTGRLITSAALIMVCVFLSFVPQPNSTVKMMALALAVAVTVDATIVRLALVPALMKLFGHRNWWPGSPPAHQEPKEPDQVTPTRA
ncbi:MMPL family transporter [Nocardia sp. CS682]|nr:MMPL family transporter [Nocardia sp. CS682]